MQWYVTVSNFARLDRNNSTLSDTAMLYAQKLIDLENIGSIYKVVGHNARADLFSLKDCEQGLIETEKAEAILKRYVDHFQGYDNMPAEAKIIYISSQIIKSKVLYHCAIEKDDPGLLEQAADIGKESTNNFQQLISRSSIGELKNRFIDYYLYLTTLTEIYIQQYLTSKDIRYLEKAFVVSEQNRSVLLQQSLSQKEKQETLSGKRKVLLNQLQELNETKFITEAKYQQGAVADSVFYNAINAQQTFFDQLQYSNDPIERSFYLDQIKVKELNISTVRKNLLNSNNCIISFQKIYNKIYLFALTKNKLNLFSTGYDRDLYQLIQVASKSLKDQSDEDRKDSYQFYRKLFEPCLNWLKSENITELILIQNQYLEDLTIEQLPTAYDARKTWNQLPLIIDTFTCSYAYSIQSLLVAKELYLLRQQKKQRLPNWQGFTNNPATGRDTLPALSGLGAEISSRFKSQFSPNSNHTYNGDKSTILQGLEKASIGQLVTHGRTTEAREDLFYLDISVGKQDAERKNIYPIDIYSRSFPLDLLLLLNCNSGKEQTINQFFGRQSIAHAFTYAGCTTTIIGLDNLKDQATTTIVNYFYENCLIKKQAVATALRMAKQRYREENPGTHPYMWSKLIVQGVADINFHD
jgi:CHAT domain-containing protein